MSRCLVLDACIDHEKTSACSCSAQTFIVVSPTPWGEHNCTLYHCSKLFTGSIKTFLTKGGQFCHRFIANSFRHLRCENFRSRIMRFDKVSFQKWEGCNLFCLAVFVDSSVFASLLVFNSQLVTIVSCCLSCVMSCVSTEMLYGIQYM